MIVLTDKYAYDYDTTTDRVEVLTLHPLTGRIVRQSSLRFPEDYPPHEVARSLLKLHGREQARKYAVAWGAWEAAMLLEERRLNAPGPPTSNTP